ncbi:hypothetical protein [Virgisporangium aurantiacum]|uniref:Uncharacterized protein n=1 Tax=Virgisporangium aurantiacum TaxID=175570 RepID=A0A8J3ZGJ9_9ACTN|nr:hypothetical protein [Virgisporangium aurantiacum]GIJ61205.1 hypothetical protein Vau01_087210 [Virgisporangium aurantiacum]
MDLHTFDLGAFMSGVGSSDITMMVKIDDERQRERRRPWTVLLAGATAFRSDCRSLEECVEVAVRELGRPLGARLDSILESATGTTERADLLAVDIDDLFTQLADRGTTVTVQVRRESEAVGDARWSLGLSGAAVDGRGIQAGGNTLDESLKSGLRELRARSAEWEWLDLYL